MSNLINMILNSNVSPEDVNVWIERYENENHTKNLNNETDNFSFEFLIEPTNAEQQQQQQQQQKQQLNHSLPQITKKNVHISMKSERYFQFSFQSNVNKIKVPKQKIPDITFKLHTPHYKNKQLYVLCTLYLPQSNDVTATTSAFIVPKLSPHILFESNKSDKSIDKPNYEPIFKKLTSTDEDEFVFQLDKYYIFKTKEKVDERITVLTNKYKETQKYFNAHNEHLTKQQLEEIDNRVTREMQTDGRNTDEFCFGFTIFEENIETFEKQPIAGPFFSNPLIELKILKITNIRGSVNGGQQITLVLCDELKADFNFKIKIYETKQIKNRKKWETLADIEKVDGTNVTFRAPAYGGDKNQDDESVSEFSCSVQLISQNDSSIRSNSVRYIYENFNIEMPSAKRQRTREVFNFYPKNSILNSPHDLKIFTDSIKEKKLLCNDATRLPTEYTICFDKLKALLRSIRGADKTAQTEILTEISKLNEDYAAQQPNHNSIFHDIISHNDFRKMYPLIEQHNAKLLLAKMINKQRETLLHFACKYDKPELIRPLIGFGCKMNAQNKHAQTPLHLAIELKHEKCIEVFSELFHDSSEYKNLTAEDFETLLETYNYTGHTVLHAAVLADSRDLVGEMLKFCEQNQIDAGEIEVLGNGNTILRLATTANLTEMSKIIIENAPKILDYENYAGKRFDDLTVDVSKTRNDFAKLKL